MIIQDHLPEIESRFGDDHFLRPDYAKYSFAQIPELVELLLGAKKGDHPFGNTVFKHINRQPQNVVVLMIDGFGYNQWLKYGECGQRIYLGFPGGSKGNSVFQRAGYVGSILGFVNLDDLIEK